MPVEVGRAGEYGHNNSAKAFVDSNFVRGGVRVVANDAGLTGLTSVSDQLKEYVTIVYHQGDSKFYLLVDEDNIATKATGWTDLSTIIGGGLQNIVEDLSPQLGANLQTNNFNIELGDSDKIEFNDSVEVYSTGSVFNIEATTDQTLRFTPSGSTGKIDLNGVVQFKQFDPTSPPAAFEGGMYADTDDNLYFGVT
jgi:hypothetical protein